MVGTPQYLAPEVVLQTPGLPGYDQAVDSWSVGIIVYAMLTKVEIILVVFHHRLVLTRSFSSFHQRATFGREAAESPSYPPCSRSEPSGRWNRSARVSFYR